MLSNIKGGSSQSSEVGPGEPLPIIFINEHAEDFSKRVKISIKNLRRVLLDNRIINNKIMIVSISGPKKTGKSFLMNISLRYLQKRRLETLINNQDDMPGFQWGSSLETVGLTIYIWSEPFMIESNLKTKVGILLLDCQGSFTNKFMMKEIFAVNAMLHILSSLQIYNVSCQIHENDLQWFAVNLDYSAMCKNQVDQEEEHKINKPFQTLCFLIRDWPYPYEFFYGAAGGQQYINRFMSTEMDNVPAENNLLRKFVDSKFTDMNGYLMPYPKIERVKQTNSESSWGELTSEFHEHVLGFMKNIFSPQSLVPKEIGGQVVTAKEFLTYVEHYFEAVISNNNPIPQSGFNSSAKWHHQMVFNECLGSYDESMKSRHLNSKSANVLLRFHEKCKNATLQKYDDASKFGMNKYSELFRMKLESQIDEEFIRFYATNPSHPVAVSQLLSIIVLAFISISTIGLLNRLLYFMNIRWVYGYTETFIFISITILIVYCLFTIHQVYNELNINTEMQTVLREQFLN